MKELKVGERVVLDIVVTKTVTCAGCFFDGKGACEVWRLYSISVKLQVLHNRGRYAKAFRYL